MSDGDHKETDKEQHLEKSTVGTVMFTCERPLEIVFKNLEFHVFIPQPFPNKRFSNLYKKPPIKRKTILRGVTGEFLPNRLTAVMGASGAGKTSMLQVLAAEGHSGLVDGHLYVNGEAIYGKQMKNLSGFVFQDDVILSTMTVREAIEMSAHLRLPKSVSAEERKARVEEVLLIMNLDRCQNTCIGNAMTKGISGGERKRCAIAMELITNPTILFLDEPTSGLDAFTAFSVIKNLKSLAACGKTVIATIHQPSAEIFFLFDDLLLMADGKVMYHGPVNKAVDYFRSQGYVCPKNTNPSDWIFMTILNNEEASESNPYASQIKDLPDGVPPPPPNETNNERVARLLDRWEASEEAKYYATRDVAPSFLSQSQRSKVGAADGLPITHEEDEESGGNADADGLPITRAGMPGFRIQFPFLFKRASRNTFRNPLMMRSRTIQTISIGLIIGLIYLNTMNRAGQAGIQDRNGLLFFVNMNAMLSTCMSILAVFTSEKIVFDREYNAGYYKLPSYFFSKIMVETPLNLVGPLFMYILIYFMSGLTRTAGCFFIFLGVVFLVNLSGFGLGFMFGSVFNNLNVALAVAPAVIIPLAVFSGLFAGSSSMPAYFRWIQYISPIKYGFEALAKNEYSHSSVAADPPVYPTAIPGSAVLEQLGYSSDVFNIGACVGMLLLIITVLFALSYLGLYNIVRKASKGLTWSSAAEIRQARKLAKLEQRRKDIDNGVFKESKFLSCAPVITKSSNHSSSDDSASSTIASPKGSEEMTQI